MTELECTENKNELDLVHLNERIHNNKGSEWNYTPGNLYCEYKLGIF